MVKNIKYLKGGIGKYSFSNENYTSPVSQLSKTVEIKKVENGVDKLLSDVDQLLDNPTVRSGSILVGSVLLGALAYKGLKKLLGMSIYSSSPKTFFNWESEIGDNKIKFKRRKKQEEKILKKRRKNPYFTE